LEFLHHENATSFFQDIRLVGHCLVQSIEHAISRLHILSLESSYYILKSNHLYILLHMTPLNWNLDLVIRTMQQLTNYLNEKACKVQGWDITPRTYWLDLLGLA
jgi:hypothetical protein